MEQIGAGYRCAPPESQRVRAIPPRPRAKDIRLLAGGFGARHAERLPVAETPTIPADADCIDFVFFTAGRHEGDAAAARHYLTWEQGLITQLDAQERGVFFPMDQDG
jgi:hypothetical protein